MATLLFPAHRGLVDIAAVFASEMKRRRKIRSIALVHGSGDEKRARETRAFDEVINVLQGLEFSGAEARLAANCDKLAAFEAGISEETLWQFIIQDSRPQFRRYSHAQNVEYLSHCLKVLQSVFARHSITAVVGELTMPCYRIAYCMCGPGRPFLFPLTARFFNRFYFDPTQYLEWPECIATYQRFMREEIPQDVLSEVDRVIKGIESSTFRPEYMPVSEPSPTAGLRLELNPSTWTQHVRETWYNALRDGAKNPQSMHWSYWTPPRKLFRWLRRTASHSYYYHYALTRPPEGVAYALFLPNTDPEYTGDVQGWPFYDQAALVRVIAQSLPAGMLLLVKDHRAMVGLRSLDFYRRIVRLPNVRLVDATLNSQALVKTSDLVLTVTGTVSMEALCLNKPVIMFGRVFFTSLEGVTVVRNLFNLPGTLAELLKSTRRGADLGRLRSARAALAAIYLCSYPGRLTDLYEKPHSLSDEARAQFGAALDTELDRRGLLTCDRDMVSTHDSSLIRAI